MLNELILDGLPLIGGAYNILTPVEGLEAPDYRVTTNDSPGEDGGTLAASYYSLRGITITGYVKGSTAADYEVARQALLNVCRLQRDSFGDRKLIKLEMVTRAGLRLFSWVHLRSKPLMSVTSGISASFQISLIAPDPLFYSTTEKTTGAIALPSGGGFVLPVILPIVSSSQVGGRSQANNAGFVATFPTLYLTGQLTNPYMLNALTSKSMQLSHVLEGGETATIDMQQKIILHNNSSSLLQAKSSDSDWWALEPGINPITISSGSASDTGTVEIKWRDAYLGV